MKTKMDDLNDDVIEFVANGSYGLTDFVHSKAKEYGVNKADVRAIINNYDAAPGSPAGRPPKSTPEVDDLDTPMYDLADVLDGLETEPTLEMEV